LIYWRGLQLSAFNDLYDFAENYVRPGDTVWDVGGNIGLLSFACAARAQTRGRVICFEPDPWSVRLLKRSSALNRGCAAPVDIIPVAVGDQLALEWLHVPERSRAASHLESTGGGAGAEITGAVRERHLIPVLTLDWLAGKLPPPNVLKIDVDGAEMRVLRGGAALLRKHRPIILTEVYERNADEATAFLHDLGYTLYQYENGESGKTPVSRTTYNTLALPNSA
jgi:FkbM family methyltransferase